MAGAIFAAIATAVSSATLVEVGAVTVPATFSFLGLEGVVGYSLLMGTISGTLAVATNKIGDAGGYKVRAR